MATTDLLEFELEIVVTTSPGEGLKICEDAFNDSYKGERGNEETKQEFFLRKLQEHVSGIVNRWHTDRHIAAQSRKVAKQANSAIHIRERKHKEPEVNELGENDPTMMPEVEAAEESFSTPTASTPKRKPTRNKRK